MKGKPQAGTWVLRHHQEAAHRSVNDPNHIQKYKQSMGYLGQDGSYYCWTDPFAL